MCFILIFNCWKAVVPTLELQFWKPFLKTTNTSWIQSFLPPPLYLIAEMMRQFNYNQPCKPIKHLKGSPRFKHIFLLCFQCKVQQCNPEVHMVQLWSFFLWMKGGEQNQLSNQRPSSTSPEMGAHSRHAGKELLVQAPFLSVNHLQSEFISSQKYKLQLPPWPEWTICALVATLAVAFLFVNVSPHLNYEVISQFKA